MGMVSPDVLKEVGLFAGLTDDELAKIAALFEPQTFPAGANVFREGDDADRIVCLESGRVVLETSAAVGGGYKHPVVVDVVARGETFGWTSVVPPHRYIATARCLSQVKVYSAIGKAMTRLLEAEPKLGYRVIFNLCQVVGERLRDTRQLVVGEWSYPT